MSQIIFSCFTEDVIEGEQFIPDHLLGYVVSGSFEITVGDLKMVFNEGDFRFIRKNQLIRFKKLGVPGSEFKSVSIFLNQETLRSINLESFREAEQPFSDAKVVLLDNCELLRTYMASMLPYLDSKIQLNDALTNLKVREAVMLLIEIHPELKRILFDFSISGKIDLEAYMNQHYKYNVKLSQFAYLTGRSLAAFKRDFKSIFKVTPSTWLLKKRLSDAYYLIYEKGIRASYVYKEVGFKNLSHFTSCFKKEFNITPNKLRRAS